MFKTKKSSGFTLVELLVVIAIIGLLSSVVLVSLNNSRAKARDARRITDLKQIQTALELYYDTSGQYPLPSRGSGVWSGHCPSYGDADDYIPDLTPNYIASLPRDPKYDESYYCYLYKSDGKDYALITHNTMETICGGDPSASCNPSHIRSMDRQSYTQPTIGVFSPGGVAW
jgi:type II secretion system protein G